MMTQFTSDISQLFRSSSPVVNSELNRRRVSRISICWHYSIEKQEIGIVKRFDEHRVIVEFRISTAVRVVGGIDTVIRARCVAPCCSNARSCECAMPSGTLPRDRGEHAPPFAPPAERARAASARGALHQVVPH